MTYLADRRFEGLMRAYRLETQELRRRLMGELNLSSASQQPSPRGELKSRWWMEGRGGSR
jgi:hypothetical protein